MVSQYLLIHSEAIIATMKELSGKNSKTAIFYPSLTHKGGGGGGGSGGKTDRYLDSPHMLSQNFLIHSQSIKATIKEI